MLTSRLTTTSKDAPIPVAEPQTIIREVPTVDIYIAKQDISIGSVIKPEMLDVQPYPKNLLLDGMVLNDPNNPATHVVNMVARVPFLKGEPLFLNKLGNDKDPSFLAASLPKGMRVVTIAVDTVSGVGNFVFPGDRVDVLITHDVKTDNNSKNADGTPPNVVKVEKKEPITEILLPNIKVLAVNQKPIINGKEPPPPLTNISLEVSAVDAQKLRLTENGNGRLSLALRSLKDRDENELARPTGLNDLSRLTPPAYFPVLYETADKSASQDMTSPEDVSGMPKAKSFVNVVRGVKAEPVEVTQP